MWSDVEENPDRGRESRRKERREKFNVLAAMAGQCCLEPGTTGSPDHLMHIPSQLQVGKFLG